MPTYTFFGVVHPERAMIDLKDPIALTYREEINDFEANCEIAVYKNQVILIMNTDVEINDFPTARNRAKDIVQGIVDIAGMEFGVAYNVDLRAVSGPNHHFEVFGTGIPELGLKNDESANVDILTPFLVAGKDPFVHRAIADIRSAISYPVDTGFFCYRAAESLINSAGREGENKDKKANIALIEKELNLDPSCIELLRRLGGPARHGRLISISGEERSRAIFITREIIRRFILFRAEKLPGVDVLRA